jgi:hypothetical protein
MTAGHDPEQTKRSGGLTVLWLTGSAIALRLITLPLEAYQARQWLRLREAQRLASAAYQLLTRSSQVQLNHRTSASNDDLLSSLTCLQRKALQRYGTSRWRALVPWGRVVGLPAFVFAALRVRQLALAGDLGGTLPGLWLKDLSEPDPFYLLPLCNMVLMLRNLEYSFPLMPFSKAGNTSAETRSPPTQQYWLQSQSLKVLLQGAVLVITPGVVNLPSAVLLFWLTNSCIQTALTSAWWRHRWHRWIQQTALPDQQRELDKFSDSKEESANRLEAQLDQALDQASREIRWVNRAIADVVRHRPVTPSLLKQVEFELQRWRARRLIQLPWRATVRDAPSGRPMLALYLESSGSEGEHAGASETPSSASVKH